jgi:hypothetical protein
VRGSRATAGAVVGLVVVLAVVLLRPGGPIGADTTEHGGPTAVTPPIVPGADVRQRFTAPAGGLSAITVRFGTLGGNDECVLRVQLRAGSEPVAGAVVDCGDVPDSALFELLRFDPQPQSDGVEYELTIGVERPAGEPLRLWLAAGEDLPRARSGDVELALPIELHTGYGDARFAFELLDTAVDRLGDDRPAWASPGVVVAAALTTLVLVVAATRARGRAIVAVLIALAVAKGIVWSAVIPPFEGNDEVAHVGYAQFVAEDHRIPRRHHAFGEVETPYSQQLRFMLEDLHVSSAPPGDRPRFGGDAADVRARQVASQSPHANGDADAAGYSPAFYVVPAALYAISDGPLHHRVLAMRWWSIALGAVATLAALAIGRRLFATHEAAAVGLAVAVAFHPMFTQQTAIVANDAMVITAGFGCLLVALDLARPRAREDRQSPRLALLAGLALGIGLLAKPFAVAYAPVLALAWLIGRARTIPEARGPARRDVAAAAGGVAVTYGSWLVVAAVANYPSAAISDLEPTAGPKGLGAFVDAVTADRLLSVRRIWVEQFWGRFSWVDTPFPRWIHTCVLLALLAGIALSIAWVAQLVVRTARRARPTSDDVHATLCLAAIASTLLMLYALGYLVFAHTGANDMIQGRYALLVLPAVLALPGLLLRRLAPAVSTTAVVVAVAAAMVTMNVVAVAVLTERFYL